MVALTSTLLIIGALGTIQSKSSAMKAIIAFMSIWGLLVCLFSIFLLLAHANGRNHQYQLALGAVGYAVGGETPAPLVRQKTYAITQMVMTVLSVIVSQVFPYLINPTAANLGAKVTFAFFGPSILYAFTFTFFYRS
jgi:hypothetical protein